MVSICQTRLDLVYLSTLYCTFNRERKSSDLSLMMYEAKKTKRVERKTDMTFIKFVTT